MKILEWNSLTEEMEQVDRYLHSYLPSEEEGGSVGAIAEALLEAPGKRYRPRLLLLSARMGQGYPASRERLCKMGAILELVHTASLIHDDIVDDSPLRRGQPTIQSRFGKDMAVYAGDLILSRIMKILFSEQMNTFGAMLGETIEQMCRGEIGQFANRYNTDMTIEQYEQNIYGKTAALFVAACKAGGIESGCEESVLTALERFGRHLGYLFQIRDDVLDFISSEDREGKPVHMDFREGIFTLPVLYALENSGDRQALCRLARRAKEGQMNETDDRILEQIVIGSGGLAKAIQAMEFHHARAMEQLKEMPSKPVAHAFRKALENLTLPSFEEPQRVRK